MTPCFHVPGIVCDNCRTGLANPYPDYHPPTYYPPITVAPLSDADVARIATAVAAQLNFEPAGDFVVGTAADELRALRLEIKTLYQERLKWFNVVWAAQEVIKAARGENENDLDEALAAFDLAVKDSR